ncbi:hypothetical protein MBAV_003116 [Candidatus Magnetobacterium bavaricum]|uniref:Uncharacterized protein n=1 Tax=Candidatus Magnetobacterium bavaricum TaxID=29290 RepID=A0A0F3GVI2_9BACT|nr:hypothetical protein MBAV_003116 [Candidatus Magnetobacterium bavaricum]
MADKDYKSGVNIKDMPTIKSMRNVYIDDGKFLTYTVNGKGVWGGKFFCVFGKCPSNYKTTDTHQGTYVNITYEVTDTVALETIAYQIIDVKHKVVVFDYDNVMFADVYSFLKRWNKDIEFYFQTKPFDLRDYRTRYVVELKVKDVHVGYTAVLKTCDDVLGVGTKIELAKHGKAVR